MLALGSAFPTLKNVTVQEACQLNKVTILLSKKRNTSSTYNLVCSNCTDTEMITHMLVHRDSDFSLPASKQVQQK